MTEQRTARTRVEVDAPGEWVWKALADPDPKLLLEGDER